jgi:hypothetical protein
MTMPDPIQLEQPRREFKNYSGNFLTRDFHLLGLLKNHHFGRHFADDEVGETEVQKCPRQKSKDFCAVGFDALVKRWDKCIDVGGGFVEK